MIALLTGEVVHEEADGALVVDVHGVGYEVLAPLGTVGRLRAGKPQGPLTFHVHTHVREDTLSLFGFSSAHEKAVFRLLLGVTTVGPRTALAILSALTPAELSKVVARRELGRLTAINGIGKRIAERLLLELRDKLPSAGGALPSTPGAASRPAGPSLDDKRAVLISALTNSGYKPAEAEKAAELLGDKVDVLPVPELVREALRLLVK